ncbi:transposase [Lysinibacillus sphaericus OT4b.31]|uniref:Transposase n=1 Tax=Lysinibacillus sphaericus OT4b.31 TaxID=1285586 RepID=R7Z862_LYSSH|nr:transposase [Lysinibacillus sphaericus OT4b.31]
MEEVDHLRHQSDMRQIYVRRKETIELVIKDAKEKHGMRWLNLARD